MLERVAMPSSRGSSRLRDPTCASYVSCTGRWVLSYILFLTMETLLLLKNAVYKCHFLCEEPLQST